MDIYDFAMQMEKDGENYYRELMSLTKAIGLKKIFALLADEEVRHYALIEQLRRTSEPPQIQQTRILDNAKNIFIEMRDSQQGPSIDKAESVEAFKKACDIEDMSRRFYLEKAEESTDEHVRLLFNRLAIEEEKHFRIMENIVEFVARPEPGQWLENAEWHHLEEY
jgi:rubrerythrin